VEELAVPAGSAALKVVPELSRDFSRQLLSQMAGPASRAAERTGGESGRRFGRRFSGGVRAGIGPMRGIFRGFGPQLAAALGGAAVLGGAKAAIDAAVDLGETVNKTGLAFGRNAAQIQQWAKGSAKNLGLPRQVAMENAATFGLLFSKLGLTGREATNMSKTMVQLAVDLGSVHNADPTEVLQAQQAAFRGEYDALQRFVPALSDAAVKQEALRATGKTSTAQLTDQERATAVYRLMLKQTSKEQGDFARTSGDAANKTKINKARFEDLKAVIGQGLLPVWNAVLGLVADKFIPALGRLAPAVGLIITGIGALGKAFRDPDVTSTGFVGFLERVGSIARAVVDWFLRMAGTLGKILGPAIKSIQEALRPAIAAFVEGLLPGLKTLWHVIATGLWPVLKALGIVIGVVLYAAIRYVLPLILRLAGPVLGFLIGTIAKAIGWLTTIIRWFARVGVAVFNLGKTIVRFVGDATRWIGSLPGKVWSALSDFAAKLRRRAGEAFVAFLAAAKSKWEDIKDWARRLPASFVKAMGNLGKALIGKFSGAIKRVLEFLGLKRDTGIFAQIGRMMIDEIALGIADRMKAIPNLLGKLRDMAGAALFGGPSIPRGSFGSNRAIVQAVARSYGWDSGGQWIALANLISGESGFNNLAQNPTSSAYGMFQFLDSTWATVGAKKTADPYAQAVAGLRYIARNYGSPAAAYGAWLGRSPHWYGEGGIFRRPTIIGVGERGPEAVVPLERGKGGNATGGLGGLGLDDDRTLRTLARHIAAAVAETPPVVYLDRQKVSRAVANGDLWNARR
jgi:hypothetical protein